MTLINALSGLAILLGLLAPIVSPSVIRSNIFMVNFPFILVVGLGSITASVDSTTTYSLEAAFDARLGLLVYIVFILILSSNTWVTQVSSFSAANYLPQRLDTKILSKMAAWLTLLIILMSMPYWLEVGFANTGFVTLIANPEIHLLAREASLKLATKTPFLILYKVGSLFSGLTLTLLWASFFTRYNKLRKLLTLLLIVFVSIISNINGSRAGSIIPNITSIYALYLFDLLSWRTYSAALFSKLRKGLISKLLLSASARALLLSVALFACFVFISLHRIARDFSMELFLDVIQSVFSRLLAVSFVTGIENIDAINSLGLSKLTYFGGFPGATWLFGAHKPIFRVTGEYIMLKYRSITETTVNMNTSGLFLNIAFWGVVAGALLFTGYILFNLILFHRYVLLFASSSSSSSSSQRLFSSLYSAWLFSTIAFNITSSTISATDLWLIFPPLMNLAVRAPAGFFVALSRR